MKKLKHSMYTQIRIGLYLMMTLGPLVIVGFLLGVKLSSASLLCHILMIQALTALFYLWPLSLAILFLIALLTLASIGEIRPDYLSSFAHQLNAFVTNFRNYSAGFDLLEANHALYALYLIGLFFCLITLYVIRRSKYSKFYFLATLLYLLYSWYSFIDSAYPYIILFISSYILLHHLKAFDALSIDCEKDFKTWSNTSFKYTVLMIAISILLPKYDAFIEWTAVESYLTDVFPLLKEWRHDAKNSRIFSKASLFDFSVTGYSSDPYSLGGPVKLNHEIAFKVQAPFPLYLRGNILTCYTGTTWTNNKNKKIEYKSNDIIPSELARGEIIHLEIINDHLSSFTLFAPYQVKSISIERDGKVWVDNNQQLTLLGARYKDEAYSIEAIVPEASPYAARPSSSILVNNTVYLDLPETLPERVRDLAKAITADEHDPYTQALLIRDYLRKHYRYDLNVSNLPFGEDFVDYFLFEDPKGYCTYFASSLSVLLRSIDIPTRYVEGFLMPNQPENGYYQVAFSNAHAWVEAYFDGRGWVTLEATPSFDPPIRPSETTAINQTNEVNLYDFSNERDYLRDAEHTRPNATAIESKEVSISTTFQTYTKYIKVHLPAISMLAMILGLLFRVLYIHYKINAYKKRLKTKSNRINYLYHNIIELYAHLGFPIQSGETEREYAKRIKKIIYDNTHNFEAITIRYTMHKYAAISNNSLVYNDMLEFFEYMEKRCYYKLGRLKYYWKKYIIAQLYTKFP